MTDTTTTTETIATELDCSGLLCPLPVYKAALVLNQLGQGDRLRLTTTDPGALRDIPAMAKQRGDKLVEVIDEENRQIFLLEKGVGK
jgi:tRNA 2-thiouridine synthesizing protein A